MCCFCVACNRKVYATAALINTLDLGELFVATASFIGG